MAALPVPSGAVTVNFAISLYARCRIETRDDDRIILESIDRGVKFETKLADIEQLAQEKQLELISKLVHFFKPPMGFHLTTDSESPASAGLGGSSALAIACIGALNRLVGERYERRKFIIIAANIETTVIRVPAGFQDYYGAFYGGANRIHFRPDGIEREALDIDSPELERRIAICYTGEPRLSGINNWEMFKSHIDGDPVIFDLFEGIRDSARNVGQSLTRGDWRQVSETMRAAYPKRKRLAPNITTPRMEMLVEKATKHGAEAAKVCGAGVAAVSRFCVPKIARKMSNKRSRKRKEPKF